MNLRQKFRAFRKRDKVSFRGVTVRRQADLMPPEIWDSLIDKSYEFAEINAAVRTVTESDRVLELGAGLGVNSAAIAKKLNVRDILCFEANPELIPFIRQLHAENQLDNIEVRNAVLTHEEPGEIDFYVCDPFWSSSLEPNVPYAKVVKVKTENANSVLRAFRPTVISCDIEGGEVSFFTEELDLSSVRLVIMEVHCRRLGGHAVSRLFETMHGHGFAYSNVGSVGSIVVFKRID